MDDFCKCSKSSDFQTLSGESMGACMSRHFIFEVGFTQFVKVQLNTSRRVALLTIYIELSLGEQYKMKFE